MRQTGSNMCQTGRNIASRNDQRFPVALQSYRVHTLWHNTNINLLSLAGNWQLTLGQTLRLSEILPDSTQQYMI